jgi:AcrR family transcriptional regulator
VRLRGVRAFLGGFAVRSGVQDRSVEASRKAYDIDSLTDVALEVFARKGFDGASMDDVARAAGITKAAIYHHVAGKEELLERGLRRALDALFPIFDEPQSREGDPGTRLRHIVRRVALTTMELLPELSVLFRVRGNSTVERRAIEQRRRFDRMLAEVIAQAQATGSVRSSLDPGLTARLIFGMTNSVLEWFRPEGRFRRSEIARTVESLLFDGLGSPIDARSVLR